MPLATRAVLVVAALASVVLLAVAARYGWHRDELYFLEAGKHLALGYVDQPPFTPLLARLADLIAPGNLFVLRLAPALATAATVVFGALLARELGGARRAQLLAAGAVGGSGFVLGAGHLLATATFDLMTWMAMLWLFTRLLRTAAPRWWVPWGVIAGLSLWNKDLVTLLVLIVGVTLLVTRRWRLLVNGWIAVGAALALAIALPQLLWQATHHWPQLEMARVLSKRLAGENRTLLVPSQLLLLSPVFVPLMVRGFRALWRSADFRPLAVAWPVGMVGAFVTAGRPYYVIPLTIVLVVAGVVATDRTRPEKRLGRLVIVSAVLTALVALPIIPISLLPSSHFADVNQAVAETVGWPQLADQVKGVVAGLSADERAHVMILTGSYGEAGAIDLFGASRGLPHAFSPHNSYWYFRQPGDDRATVVAVRMLPDELAPFFRECRQVGRVDNGLDVANEVQGEPIVVCRGLLEPWAFTWPRLKFLA
jgi:4-amino-4-deoxy-L-arabinose transferase-like glycosyltransferase